MLLGGVMSKMKRWERRREKGRDVDGSRWTTKDNRAGARWLPGKEASSGSCGRWLLHTAQERVREREGRSSRGTKRLQSQSEGAAEQKN
jgi:hypothetical protein